MWSLNDLQIDSTLRQCLTPSTSSNCTLCEGVAFIGFSQTLILISMSDQSPLLSHFFLIGIRKLRGWRSSADYLDFSMRLSLRGGSVLFPCAPKTHRRFSWLTKYCVCVRGRELFRLTFRGANSILAAWWWYNWFHSSLWAVMTFLSCHKQPARQARELRHEETITIAEAEVEDLKSGK